MECGALCRSVGGRYAGGRKQLLHLGMLVARIAWGEVGYYGTVDAVEADGISGISWFVGLEGR
jgi:hypothetical protein